MMMEQTYNQMLQMRLFSMAQTLREQLASPQSHTISFEDRVGMLVDAEWTQRQQKALERRLRGARLRDKAEIEDIYYQQPRGLDKSVMASLASCDWVSRHQNILLTGPTGIGKTYLLCALTQKAIREGFTAAYHRVSRLSEGLRVSRADGSLSKLLTSLSKVDVLALDDWGLAPLEGQSKYDFMEIFEDRYNRRSTIIASQIPVCSWHTYIGDATVADAIVDRLVHNAHRLDLNGPSMRQAHLTVEKQSGTQAQQD